MEGNSSLGMKENVAGLLCYLFGWITGLIFFLLEKSSNFVKFHAAQSLVTFACLSILGIVISILTMIFRGVPVLDVIITILSWLNSIATLVCWLVGMITAFQNKTVKFPIFGDIAESLVNKNNPPA